MPPLISKTFIIRQQLLQFEMMEALEAENLTTIEVKIDKLQWTRAGKEIKVDGHLFDVEEISISGDHYIIKGLFDEKEAQLVNTIEKSNKESPYNKPLQALLLKVFSHVLFIEDKAATASTGMLILPPQYMFFAQTDFNAFSPSPGGPPPKDG